LVRFDFLAADACGSLSEPFNSDDAFVRGEKPSFCTGIWDEETPNAEEEGQAAGEEIDVLPAA
jgi:hypothetical protein